MAFDLYIDNTTITKQWVGATIMYIRIYDEVNARASVVGCIWDGCDSAAPTK